jgi:protein TonB
VDGDAAENARERKTKRRAVAFSIALQSAGLAALVIAPLFAKPAELTERIAVPIPPYSHHPTQQRTTAAAPTKPHVQPSGFFQPTNIPVTIRTHDQSQPPGEPLDPGSSIELPGTGNPAGPLNDIDSRRQPPPPPDTREKKRVVMGHIDPALLTRRVEPVFPALARQLRKNGRVELHAVIAMDGSVQSLEVVSGDPLFVNSSLEAVRQWHYKPTYLNGQPVEIDTYITVIYTLQ